MKLSAGTTLILMILVSSEMQTSMAMNPADPEFTSVMKALGHDRATFVRDVHVTVTDEFRRIYPRTAELISLSRVIEFKVSSVLRWVFFWKDKQGEILCWECFPSRRSNDEDLPEEIIELWNVFGGFTGNFSGPPSILFNSDGLLDYFSMFEDDSVRNELRMPIDVYAMLRAYDYKFEDGAIKPIGGFTNGDTLVWDSARDDILVVSEVEEHFYVWAIPCERVAGIIAHALRFRPPKQGAIRSLVEHTSDLYLAALAPPPTRFVRNDLQRKRLNTGIEFVRIPAGQFLMGSPETELFRNTDENQKTVTISKPFFMSVNMVTIQQALQWLNDDRFAVDPRWIGIASDANPGPDLRLSPANAAIVKKGEMFVPNIPKGVDGVADLPVTGISWYGANAFCRWLEQMDPGKTFRLPTEAEWEYCCRARTTTTYWFGDQYTNPAPYEWTSLNASRLQPVGTRLPNPWGLFDMAGNAQEWCGDWYQKRLVGGIDPVGAPRGMYPLVEAGGFRVQRGNRIQTHWGMLSRSAARSRGQPHWCHWAVGFRVVMEADEK